MEAKGKHNFTSTAPDELSFCKHDLLKILNVEEDINWFQAEKDGELGLIPSNHIIFIYPSWYVGSVGRVGAVEILMEKDEKKEEMQEQGAFVVRLSENVKGNFSVSVKGEREVQHFKVTRTEDRYSVWSRSFQSLNDLVNFYRTSSISKNEKVLLKDRQLLKVVANYDYKPQDSEELELKRGDIVLVTRKQDENWWEGEVVRGSKVTRGVFPKTFSTIISH